MSTAKHRKDDTAEAVTEETTGPEETADGEATTGTGQTTGTEEETADAEAIRGTEDTADAEAVENAETEAEGRRAKRGIAWTRVLAFGVLPGLALLMALGAGYLKWLDTTARATQTARNESVRAASDSTIAMLSYKTDTVDHDLGSAQDRLTGQFKDNYNALTHEAVIPEARQRRISAVTSVPAAASVSASANHAVVLVFVDQTVTVGQDPPTNSASSVRVTLDKIGGKWLISDFIPV